MSGNTVNDADEGGIMDIDKVEDQEQGGKLLRKWVG